MGADRRDALGHRRLVRVISGADRAAGNGLLPLRPNHPKPLECAAGPARNVDHGTQEECVIGNFCADFFMRLRPDNRLAAKPSVDRRGTVVLAVPPYQVSRWNAFRLLFNLTV